MELSIVIPVYNSQEIMPTLLERLDSTLRSISELNGRYEVILVEDGSKDDSWGILSKLAEEKYDFVHPIKMMRNYGQHNALLCGIRAAKYEWIMTMDDDLQHPPDQISLMLAAMKPGIDVVYGVGQTMDHGLWRNLLAFLSKRIFLMAMGVSNINSVSAFRLFRRDLRNGFSEYNNAYVSIDVLLSWSTERFLAIKTTHAPRFAGQSGYTLRKLVRHALNMLLGFSVVPLRLSMMLGFTFMIFGFLLLAYVLTAYFIMEGVPGFSFLASSISIFSGVQLFSIGIIGEYISRIYIRSMGRPSYTSETESHANQ